VTKAAGASAAERRVRWILAGGRLFFARPEPAWQRLDVKAAHRRGWQRPLTTTMWRSEAVRASGLNGTILTQGSSSQRRDQRASAENQADSTLSSYLRKAEEPVAPNCKKKEQSAPDWDRGTPRHVVGTAARGNWELLIENARGGCQCGEMEEDSSFGHGVAPWGRRRFVLQSIGGARRKRGDRRVDIRIQACRRMCCCRWARETALDLFGFR